MLFLSRAWLRRILMNEVTLRKITQENYLDCFKLELAPGQDKFVSHPIRSLAQAYVYYHQCTPFGIYAGEKMVGYVLVIYDYDEQTYNIWHMMIDRRQQNRGYGKAAMTKLLDYIRQKPLGESDHVLLTCSPDNRRAMSIYHSFGFTESGRFDEDETELELILK